jgi:hypothetical protein
VSASEVSLAEAIPDPEVAAYYRDFPAQLPLDHPHLERTAVWKRIEKLAPRAKTPPAPTQHVGTAAAARAITQLRETGSLPVEAQERAAAHEAERRRRARLLGLPEDEGLGRVSEDQIRRARLGVVEGGED